MRGYFLSFRKRGAVLRSSGTLTLPEFHVCAIPAAFLILHVAYGRPSGGLTVLYGVYGSRGMLALLSPCAGCIEAGSYYGYTYAVAHILVDACTHDDVCLGIRVLLNDRGRFGKFLYAQIRAAGDV